MWPTPTKICNSDAAWHVVTIQCVFNDETDLHGILLLRSWKKWFRHNILKKIISRFADSFRLCQPVVMLLQFGLEGDFANCICAYRSISIIVQIPTKLIPARGGAEVALDLTIKYFSSIELACAVRTCCTVVVQEHDLRATTLQRNAK